MPALNNQNHSITIDGITQAQFSGEDLNPFGPEIVVDGTHAGAVDGIIIESSGTTVSGLNIRNFAGNGIAIVSGTDNSVFDNYIGTDAQGREAMGNDTGVYIATGSNVVGRNETKYRNIISGNDRFGVSIDGVDAESNQIFGNYIGTDAEGTEAIGNGESGVLINDASYNQIGAADEGNLISGNVRLGIAIVGGSANNQVAGNLVGTSLDGDYAIGNEQTGVVIQDSSDNVIGGNGDGDGNVISGNGATGSLEPGNAGIYIHGIQGQSARNVVAGNYIGVDITGSIALPNEFAGISILNGNDNIVGGIDPNLRNVVSANIAIGIRLEGESNSGNQIEGNLIGTDAAGTADLGNGQFGVLIKNAPQNYIGSGEAGARNIISGNDTIGVGIVGEAASGNRIVGNYIGTNITGSVVLGNAQTGVVLQDASSNVIGGPGSGEGNVISGNGTPGEDNPGNAGVYIHSINGRADSNSVEGNYIGVDASGAMALGNLFNGISIVDSANNIIGGSDPGSRNIVSGNGKIGIAIAGATSSNNRILGNFIGTNATGTAALGNAQPGVAIQDASNNYVGGTRAGEGNVISGNGTAGVEEQGNAGIYINAKDGLASANQVLGNYIGVDVTGTIPIANAFVGVSINSASENSIGGVVPEARNVISGNAAIGIRLEGSKATGNRVEGNHIGIDAIGDSRVGNGQFGILIKNAGMNRVGGSDTNSRNIISGNDKIGVGISGSESVGNRIVGNYIGTDVSGTFDIANAESGVVIQDASGNFIGGGETGEGNLISGNGEIGEINPGNAGIYIHGLAGIAENNQVRGNTIGLNADGTEALGNGQFGISVFNSPNNIIGGINVNERNIVSGNFGSGISIRGAVSENNKVTGNWIGVDATGSQAIGNRKAGIEILDASNNMIGGTESGTQNVISGNGDEFGSDNVGVYIHTFEGEAQHNKIVGNLIGVDTEGTAPLGNSFAGVAIDGGVLNQIGGPGNGEGNVISGGYYAGVSIDGSGSSKNRIQGNFIGMDRTSTLDLGNNGPGVRVYDSSENLIGGTKSGEGNQIAYNDIGVVIDGDAQSNAILSNGIYNNVDGGIDLNGDGTTVNDLLDGDVGGNGLQNFPVLVQSTGLRALGFLKSAANSEYRIEFFAIHLPFGSIGQGQGKRRVGASTVKTDVNGFASFKVKLTYADAFINDYLVATATRLIDTDNDEETPSLPTDTSEFSDVLPISTNLDLYVDDDFAALSPGDPIDDADPRTPGNQRAIFGVNAFDNLSDANKAAAGQGVLRLAPGQYSGFKANGSVIIDGGGAIGGSAIISGSPAALTVDDGDVLIRNGVTIQTSSESPAIKVNGGSLKLRDCVVLESSDFDQPAISVDGGLLDLGMSTDPGGNLIQIRDQGSLIDVAPGTVDAVAFGNQWQLEETPLTHVGIERFIKHKADSDERGMVTWFVGDGMLSLTGASIGAQSLPIHFTINQSISGNYLYSIDWDGDGVEDEQIHAGDLLDATHSFEATGEANISVAAINQATGTLTTAAHSIEIVSSLPTSEVSFETTASEANEAVGFHNVNVVLNIPSGAALTEDLTLDVFDARDVGSDPADPVNDYHFTRQTITFAASSTSGAIQTVAVQIVNDDIVEPTESLRLQLSDVSIPGVIFAPNSHLVQIIDDDPVHGPTTLGDFVWNDLNGDGVQDSDEPGIAGVTVFIDDNNNGAFDDGELAETTDANGAYDFVDLAAGAYVIRVDLATAPVGYTLTTDNSPLLVNLTAGEDFDEADFGFHQQLTFMEVLDERVWLQVSDISQDGVVVFAWGTETGETYFPEYGVTLGIKNPTLSSLAEGDSDGMASGFIPISFTLEGEAYLFQAFRTRPKSSRNQRFAAKYRRFTNGGQQQQCRAAFTDDLPSFTATVDKPFAFEIANDLVVDPDSNAPLVYNARLTDGSALPNWLSFDATNLGFRSDSLPTAGNGQSRSPRQIVASRSDLAARTSFCDQSPTRASGKTRIHHTT
ncbi:MAG: SdrD B-like domain-containing protein [Pirellulaceae bacterium]